MEDWSSNSWSCTVHFLSDCQSDFVYLIYIMIAALVSHVPWLINHQEIKTIKSFNSMARTDTEVLLQIEKPTVH